jgi:hypothetical protein
MDREREREREREKDSYQSSGARHGGERLLLLRSRRAM